MTITRTDPARANVTAQRHTETGWQFVARCPVRSGWRGPELPTGSAGEMVHVQDRHLLPYPDCLRAPTGSASGTGTTTIVGEYYSDAPHLSTPEAATVVAGDYFMLTTGKIDASLGLLFSVSADFCQLTPAR